MLALGVAPALGQLVALGAVDAAVVGEEQQPAVRRGDEEVVDDVVLAQRGPADALAAAVLGAVGVGAGALGVAGAGDGDDHVLLGDEVLHAHLAVEGHDPGAALVAVLLDDLGQLAGDDAPLALRGGDDLAQVLDAGAQLLGLLLDLEALQGGQTAQLEGEDGLGLGLVDVQQAHEAGAGLLGGGRAPDEGDDGVEGVDRLEQALEDVEALLGLAQAEAGAAHDDVDLVGDPVAHEPVQAQGARHPVDQGEHVGREVVLELGALVEVVEDHLGDGVALEDDDQSLTGAPGGLVTDVGDAGDLAVAHELGDLVGQVVGVDLVGQLSDDEALAALDLLDVDHGPLGDGSAAGTVGVLDAPPAQDRGAGGEVGSGDPLDEGVEQLLARGVGVLEVPLGSAGDLAQVVRRDAGGHADGDALGAVDQEVGEPRRQDDRLLVASVVVVLEVDAVLVDVPEHLHG